jgi:hypothetical protein
MSSFGKWYEEQQAGEAGDGSSAGSSWGLGSSDQMLPLFTTEGMQNLSFDSMKQSMEASMPKKILGMGYQQRFKVFCALLFLSGLFFALAFFVGLPMIALKPQKFALSFTCGSLTFMGSFAILKGPVEHLTSMFTADRMFFTTIYFGSMFLTLYLTFTKGGINGYVLVLSASGVQLVSLLWYLLSFLPGGSMGLSLVLRAMGAILAPVISGCIRVQGMCIKACYGWVTRS